MDKETIERANKLERQIKSLKGLLKGDCMLLWRGFAIHYVVNFGPSQGNDVYHDISFALDYDEACEINDKLKGILKDVFKEIIINKIIPWINSLPEEPVSKDLEEAALRANMIKKDIPKEFLSEYPYNKNGYNKFIEGANWQKEYIVKEIKSRLVDAATNQDNSPTVAEQTYYNGMVDALGRLRDKLMED